MLENIYEVKRNKLKHDDLNKSHVFREGSNAALREAVEILLNFNKPLSFRKDYGADRGDIKYLQNVLLQHGVIRQVQTIGSEVLCELEQNINNFSKVMPALAAMLEKLQSLGTMISPQGLINDYMKIYGIGYNASILFFAVLKRYFKDSLIILPEAQDIGTLKTTSYDSLLDLLYYQKYKNAVMEYKEVQAHDEFFMQELYKSISNQSLTIETTVTIDLLHERLKEWYEGLDVICKVKNIYETDELERFIEVFNKINSVSARDFILEEIKTIYGYARTGFSFIGRCSCDHDKAQE